MKKIVFASAALISAMGTANVLAAAVCSGATTAGNGAAVTASGFVVQDFTPKCSANVFAEGLDQTSIYAVGAASRKGKNMFGGSTNGGGVAPNGTCAAAGACTSTEAATSASSAAAAGASS